VSVIRDPELESLLTGLHARSDAQAAAMRSFEARWAGHAQPPAAKEARAFLSDKLVALDRDKAELCYQLCRANDARKIVEIGTSYGVSTLYLAAAVRDNIRAVGGDGVVIGTEYEPNKACAARAHFEQTGLSRFIDLREGDLRETLRHIDGPVDFMLVDIWIAMARPALELVTPVPEAWRHCSLRQYRAISKRLRGVFRISRSQRVPNDDDAIRRRSRIVRAVQALINEQAGFAVSLQESHGCF
jgi:predicted O-methyltransferase YrrM